MFKPRFVQNLKDKKKKSDNRTSNLLPRMRFILARGPIGQCGMLHRLKLGMPAVLLYGY